MNPVAEICHIDRLDLTFARKPWAFAIERRAEIDAHFAARQREKPKLWNGRVLLLHDEMIANGVLQGEFLETDYASFMAWYEWGRPPAGARDCFGAAAIATADGAFLLGVMAEHTANAGRVYFPSGTPDLDDVIDGKVDLDFSVARELKEESGLDIAEFDVEPGWTVVINGPQIANIKVLRSSQSAEALRARIMRYLATEAQPELADIRVARGLADIEPAMSRSASAFLAHRFAVR